ncbi:MAG: hypothetical protein KIT09_01115 [Bryobacteraceae bacterium]|nr:hypothetical protein [Bryobacteraceae bacterium]
MKRLSLLILAGALSLGAAGESRTFTGVITDTMCGKDHAHMGITPDAKCVRECVRMSSEYKYALQDGDKMYVLSDQKTPEQFAAQKVKITGVLYEKTGIIKVEKIEPAK